MKASIQKNIMFLVMAILSVFAAALFAGCGGDDSETSTSSTPEVSVEEFPAAIVSENEIVEVSDRLDYPIFWAGDDKGADYELTITADGRAYVRYLTDGAEAGDPRATFLAVSTYPAVDGLASLESAAESNPDAELVDTKDDGVMLINPAAPNNVYVAYPQSNYQIEVYSPDAKEAVKVASEKLEPLN